MNKICFVIMGYGKKTDYKSGKTFDLDKTYLNVIKPAVESSGLTCIRGDEIKESSIIDKSMYSLLIKADLVIADITTFNPNAIYELGVRHASKPFSTIIIQEKNDSIPFDLSHNKIFHYEHMGDDIGATEAQRCIRELKEIINNLIKFNEIDSPFFQYIPSIRPYDLPEDEFCSFIKELAEKEEHLFAIVEQAKMEMVASNFIKAKELWAKALDKVEDEPYYIQQYALATYKSEYPSKLTALNDALSIISKLKPNLTNDPETLGLTGAIYKRLWLLSQDEEFLNRAIKIYRKGFQINNDYYTGENYAICLDYKCQIEQNDDEKTYSKVGAKKARETIIEVLTDILKQDNYKQRNDLKWIYASLSNCSLALGMEYTEYEKLFYEMSTSDWEKETYESTKKHLLTIVPKEN